MLFDASIVVYIKRFVDCDGRYTVSKWPLGRHVGSISQGRCEMQRWRSQRYQIDFRSVLKHPFTRDPEQRFIAMNESTPCCDDDEIETGAGNL